MAIDKALFKVMGEFASTLSKYFEDQAMSKDDRNNADICAVVKKMMNYKGFDESDFEVIIKKLESIYLEGHRHSYSNISSTIYAEKEIKDIECQKNNIDNDQLDVLADNNDRLHEQAIKYFKNKAGEDDQNNEIVLIKFHKLYDHINLEVVRLKNYDEQIRKAINRINDSAESTRKQIDEFHNKIDAKGKEIDERIQKRLDEAKDESNKMKSEYISILGIFASIVLSFAAGMAYSTSVLSNIHKASIYRTIIVATLVGMIVIAIMWLLMDFIKSIHGESKRNYKYIIVPEVILALIIILTCTAYKYDWFAGEEVITREVYSNNIEVDNSIEEEASPSNA